MSTLRTVAADSATKMQEGDLGSGMAAKILDFRATGLPNLFDDFASRRSLLATSALSHGISLIHEALEGHSLSLKKLLGV